MYNKPFCKTSKTFIQLAHFQNTSRTVTDSPLCSPCTAFSKPPCVTHRVSKPNHQCSYNCQNNTKGIENLFWHSYTKPKKNFISPNKPNNIYKDCHISCPKEINDTTLRKDIKPRRVTSHPTTSGQKAFSSKYASWNALPSTPTGIGLDIIPAETPGDILLKSGSNKDTINKKEKRVRRVFAINKQKRLCMWYSFGGEYSKSVFVFQFFVLTISVIFLS